MKLYLYYYYLYEISQLNGGEILSSANFLSNPQNTCTEFKAADVTGSGKAQSGEFIAPITLTEPSRSGLPPKHFTRPALS